MEDKTLTQGEACVDMMLYLVERYCGFLERMSESKLTAIKTCTNIASSLDTQSCLEAELGPVPQETLALAQRFLQEYGPRYWYKRPSLVFKFEYAILRPSPKDNDLPEHTNAELKQLNELLTKRLETQDVDEWSMEEMHQALSLALSTFDVMANDKRWNLKIKIAL